MKSKVNADQPLSRTQMLAWINKTLSVGPNLLQINETKIENLGTGVIYCLLLNYFKPGIIPQSRIVMLPRNHHDYRTNIRRLQEGLTSLELKSITFDVMKLTEMAFHENWNLICKLYKYFVTTDKKQQSWTHETEKQPLKQQWWNPNLTVNKINESHKTHQSMYSFQSTMGGMQTPMKSLKSFDQNGRIRNQSSSLLDEIKKIVTSQEQSDKIKVKYLKKLLGLQDEDNAEQDKEMKDLLSDFKKKEEVIQID